MPIAVTAISGAQLAASGVQNTEDLSAVTPGLTFPESQGYAQPHIRGVGSTATAPGNESSVALYVDGVYYADPIASILTLTNVSQIEVLKGPQGTLFGRNATGGLIQVTTRDPTTRFQGNADFSYGNYDTSQINFYVTGGLTDTLAADFAAQATHQGDGYGTDLATGQPAYKLDSDLALRSKILWRPSGKTQIRLELDYESSRSSNNALSFNQAAGIPNPLYPPGSLDVVPFNTYDNADTNFSKGGGVSLQISQDLGFAKVVSTTAYRNNIVFLPVDFDLGPQPYTQVSMDDSENQVTQEIQLQGSPSGRFQWTTGLFYFHAVAGYDPNIVTFSGPAETPIAPGVSLTGVQSVANQTTDSIAGYGQATFKLTSNLNLTGGFRFTHETKSFDGTQTGTLNGVIPIPLATANSSFDINKPTWRVSLDYKPYTDILLYASYNRGFKSGGYNPGDVTSAPYQAEQLDAYEIGAKTQFFNRRVRLNAAGFYYNYQNIQVARYVNGVPEVYNGASAQVYGTDLDVQTAITSQLFLTGGIEALHDNFISFPCAEYEVRGPMVSAAGCPVASSPSLPYDRSAAGNKLPDTPDVSLDVALDYKLEFLSGHLDLNGTYSYVSRFYFEPNNSFPQDSYNLVNLSAKWMPQSEKYFLRLYAKNVGDARYLESFTSSAIGAANSFGAPRTYGFTVGYSF